ncbi:MAG: hypothetical protein IKP86_13275 [Anaerolineaceae bacterium]|nr:hypothetical protein [Anaerolineaceae bacterium]
MKIRLITINDWEKVYDFDRSIIRVGSQSTCDIQVKDQGIQPLQMQIVRTGGQDVRYVMRFFAENMAVTRGGQSFPAEITSPYDVLDGDMIVFGNYRLIINLEDEKTRVRTSEHISAEMSLSRRDLSLESSINGMVKLKNLGTEKPCQFRMQIKGIPEECMRSAPLPYLYPGASSSVGFIISHLQTKPAPGFHTVSIVLTAPDEYYGETLEFNQDIYVKPVFINEIILEDDSEELAGFNDKQQREALRADNIIPVVSSPQVIQESGMMNVDDGVSQTRSSESDQIRVISGKENHTDFDETIEDTDDDVVIKSRKKRRRVSVIHSRDQVNFEGEEQAAETSAAPEKMETQPEPEVHEPVSADEREEKDRKGAEIEVKPETKNEEPPAEPVPDIPENAVIPETFAVPEPEERDDVQAVRENQEEPEPAEEFRSEPELPEEKEPDFVETEMPGIGSESAEETSVLEWPEVFGVIPVPRLAVFSDDDPEDEEEEIPAGVAERSAGTGSDTDPGELIPELSNNWKIVDTTPDEPEPDWSILEAEEAVPDNTLEATDGKDRFQIPVIKSSGSFADFEAEPEDDDDPVLAPDPDEERDGIRVMKGGQFDE